jgi:galactonate dehydratase
VGRGLQPIHRDRAITAQVEELGRYIVGRDPFHIRHILQIAFEAQRRGSLELYCATSAIEQALWDIIGKATQQPVYNLIGGPCRSRIRVYANGWSYKMEKPDDYARGAEEVMKRGFTAMKFDPVPGVWRTYAPKEHIRHAVKALRAVRDAVGSDVDLLSISTGASRRYTPSISRTRRLSSNPTGSKNPVSRRTSRRSPRCGGQAAFRS